MVIDISADARADMSPRAIVPLYQIAQTSPIVTEHKEAVMNSAALSHPAEYSHVWILIWILVYKAGTDTEPQSPKVAQWKTQKGIDMHNQMDWYLLHFHFKALICDSRWNLSGDYTKMA